MNPATPSTHVNRLAAVDGQPVIQVDSPLNFSSPDVAAQTRTALGLTGGGGGTDDGTFGSDSGADIDDGSF